MSSKSVLIFCESYVQLENSLNALELHKNNNVTVIVGLSTLYQLFCNVVARKYKFNIVKLCDDKIGCGNRFNNSLSRLIRMFGMRFFHIPNVIKSLADSKFELTYIFTFTFNWPTYHVIKAICLKSDIVYVHSKDYSYEPTEQSITRFGLLNIILRFLAKIMFGRGVDLIRFQNGTITSNFEACMIENLKTYIGPSKRSQWLAGYSSRKTFSINHPYKVIYFDAGVSVNEWFEDPNSAPLFINNTLDILNKRFGSDAIGIKYHPSTPPGAGLEKYGVILESYVPADWYCNGATILIGIFTSAVYFSENGCRILLYEIVNWQDAKLYLDFMRNSVHSRAPDPLSIYTPKTLAEFESFLNSI